MIAAVAAIVGVMVTVLTTAYTQEAQRATQRQADFTAASQQLAAADAFSQAAGITTLATLAKNDPAAYREPVCQIAQPYITQASATDLAHSPKATESDPGLPVAYRPGVLLALQNISPNCSKWSEFKLPRWSLPNADLRGVNLSKADLIYANLASTDLSAAHLDNAHLDNARLIDADLTYAHLNNARLMDADLTRARLSGPSPHLGPGPVDPPSFQRIGAYLVGAYLVGANLTGANLTGADLSYADLSKTELSETDLSGADLSGADLSDAELGGIKYDKNTKWPQGFTPPPSR